MSASGYKRLTVAFAVTCVGLLALCGFLFDRYRSLSIRVLWACRANLEFHVARAYALRSDSVPTAALHLRNVVVVYPLAIKMDTNSPLDKMVEGERAFAVRSIVEYLRAKTGEDLGDSPEAWIREYCP